MQSKKPRPATESVETITCHHCRYERPASDARCHICGYPWTFETKQRRKDRKRRK